MIAELDIVVLTHDIPSEGLEAGDVGTVVMSYDNGKSFEVEFSTLTGQTVSVVTVKPEAIRSVQATDMAHVRHAATG